MLSHWPDQFVKTNPIGLPSGFSIAYETYPLHAAVILTLGAVVQVPPSAKRRHLDARGRGPSAAVGETPVQICRVRAELRARVVDRGRGVRGRIRGRRRAWIRSGRSADVDEDAHLAALHRAGGDLLVGDGDGAAVDLIGVGAVVECGVEAGAVPMLTKTLTLPLFTEPAVIFLLATVMVPPLT